MPARKTKGSAIVIIDMQPWFLEDRGNMENGPYKHKRRLINNCRELITWGMKNKLPIMLMTYDIEHEMNAGEKGWSRKYGAPSFNITIPELIKPCANYKKMMMGMKHDDDGSSEIVQMLPGIRNFYLAGVNAAACVASTGEGLVSFGRNAYAVDECCVNVWDDEWITAADTLDHPHFSTPAIPLKKLRA